MEESRAKWSESVKRLGVAELATRVRGALPEPRRNIIADSEAQNIVVGLCFGYVSTGL